VTGVCSCSIIEFILLLIPLCNDAAHLAFGSAERISSLACAVLDAFTGHTARIAKGALVDRLRTPDEEVFSREEMTSTVKRRYKALFHT
jgi:hypothetical protein